MSVLICGMEMPKNAPLIVKINPDGSVSTTAKNGYKKYEAVPVPPHGRLGDLDELEKSFREDADAEWNRYASPANWADAFDDVANIVADAPTIIPAEEGEI